MQVPWGNPFIGLPKGEKKDRDNSWALMGSHTLPQARSCIEIYSAWNIEIHYMNKKDNTIDLWLPKRQMTKWKWESMRQDVDNKDGALDKWEKHACQRICTRHASSNCCRDRNVTIIIPSIWKRSLLEYSYVWVVPCRWVLLHVGVSYIGISIN